MFQLSGVRGHTKSTEITDVVCPILTKSKTPYFYATCDMTLTLTDTKDTILSLAVLLKDVASALMGVSNTYGRYKEHNSAYTNQFWCDKILA